MPSGNYDSTLLIQIKNLDEKFSLLMGEAEKRNGQRFDAQQEAVSTAMTAAEKAVSAAMAAAEKAVAKAETAAEKRFEAVNEFRQTLGDQQRTFLTRTEYNVQHQALSDRVDTMNVHVIGIDRLLGELRERGAGRSDIWSILVASVGMLISLATLGFIVFRH